nr:hypothetical protein [Methylobacterium sp. L1A1]
MSDDRTLVEILDKEASSAPVHDAVAAQIGPLIAQSPTPRRIGCTVGDPVEFVSGFVQQVGRGLGHGATWIRFVDEVRGRGLLAVVHCPTVFHEAELIIVAEPGVLSRSVVRDLCRWAFHGLGLLRIVVRVRSSDTKLADYLRRGGFAFEGEAKDYFTEGDHASVWAMSIYRCPWLPRPQWALPTVDISPPSSIARH